MSFIGYGEFERDVLDFPWLYIYDSGAVNENPEKGNLNYG